MFHKEYGEVFEGDERWNSLPVPDGRPLRVGRRLDLRQEPALLRRACPTSPPPVDRDPGAPGSWRVLGDSITTDHISPAGSIKVQSPAGHYLIEHGVDVVGLQLLRLAAGQPRGHGPRHVRQRPAPEQARPGTEGGFTRHLPDGEVMSIFEASERYRAEEVPLIILAGKEYGSGSSRDWAAKGPKLLGIRAVIAESYERIHRSNLVGMGILPLQFGAGDNAESLGLTGEEIYSIEGLAEGLADGLRRRPRGDGRGRAGRRRRRTGSRRRSGSTRRRRSATMSTAGFCRTCSGSCSPGGAEPPAPAESRPSPTPGPAAIPT